MATRDTVYMHAPLYVLLSHKDRSIASVPLTATVDDAVAVMNENGTGSVLVMEKDRLAGIFTERDVLVRVVATHRDPAATAVADVMTGELVHVAPSASVQEALQVMNEANCRHLPVIDGGRLVGVISVHDLTAWMVHHHEQRIDDLVRYITGGYADAD